VAEGVVDLLEAVEVQEEGRAGRAAAPRPPERLAEVVEEEGAVGQPGQRVVVGQVGEAGLERRALADVAHHPHGRGGVDAGQRRLLWERAAVAAHAGRLAAPVPDGGERRPHLAGERGPLPARHQRLPGDPEQRRGDGVAEERRVGRVGVAVVPGGVDDGDPVDRRVHRRRLLPQGRLGARPLGDLGAQVPPEVAQVPDDRPDRHQRGVPAAAVLGDDGTPAGEADQVRQQSVERQAEEGDREPGAQAVKPRHERHREDRERGRPGSPGRGEGQERHGVGGDAPGGERRAGTRRRERDRL